MSRTVLRPLIALAVALLALGVAFVLDTGDAASRDAALLVGTAALWGVAAATLWLLAVVGYLAYRRHRAGRS